MGQVLSQVHTVIVEELPAIIGVSLGAGVLGGPIAAVAAPIAYLFQRLTRVELKPNPLFAQVTEAIQKRHEIETVRARWPYPMTPDVWPTEEEFDRAMAMIQGEEGSRELLHFGVSGVVKSGKSSLLNSFRGLRAKAPGAARTGSSETTFGITRYNDPRPGYPFAWYDIAGFGTASVPANVYFNSHGLFALDCIMILIKDSFQESDAVLIRQCRNLSIPTYLVRSFSDQRIRSIMEDGATCEEAREEYIRDAEANTRKGLADFLLDEQRVYLVNARTMLSLIVGTSQPDDMIHEAELLRDVLLECERRRGCGSTEP